MIIKKTIFHISLLAALPLISGCGKDCSEYSSSCSGCSAHDTCGTDSHGHDHGHDHGNGGNAQLNGFVTKKDETFENIQVNGTARFNGVTVTETATINGTVNARDTEFKNLVVNGKASLNESSVTNNATISGFLISRNSTLKNVIVSSDLVIVKDESKANVITVKDNHSDQVQRVEVSGNSLVENIAFDREGGVVIVKDNSKVDFVLRGEIIKE